MSKNAFLASTFSIQLQLILVSVTWTDLGLAIKWLANGKADFVIGILFPILGCSFSFFLAPLMRQAIMTKSLSDKGFLTKTEGGILSSIAISVQMLHLPSAKVRPSSHNDCMG